MDTPLGVILPRGSNNDEAGPKVRLLAVVDKLLEIHRWRTDQIDAKPEAWIGQS